MQESLLQCLWHSKDTLACLAPYAYEPTWVYGFLVTMMLLSAIGLPFPEEATLVSVGILAYMGAHPDKYPPPFPGAPFVHAETAAAVAFVSVLFSDLLIYGIGRMFGRQVFDLKPMRAILSEENRQKIEVWTKKYGAYACGIFRFTPGIRFPGHLACGMLRFPAWKFGLIDGIAALISVPTQILLLSHYGETILGFLKQFKIVVLCLLTVALLMFIYKKWVKPRFSPS